MGKLAEIGWGQPHKADQFIRTAGLIFIIC